MRILIAIFISGLALQLQAQEKPSINWMTLEEVDVAMAQEPKKIFVDLYTDWCRWCKVMDQNTFSDPNIIDYMNRNYYCVKFNAETRDTVRFNNFAFYDVSPTAKRGTNLFAYSILDGQMSYPSFAVLDENKSRIDIISGYKAPEPFMGLMIFFATNEYKNYTNYLYQQLQKQAQPQGGQ